jgi:hypothetical protein
MPKGRVRAVVLTAFACWLVLLASGDDFNLARMALLPSSLPSEDLLPLDDPNSDFTASSQSPGPTDRDRRSCTSPVGQRVPGSVLNSSSDDPTHSRPPHHSGNTPLRC